MTTDKLDWHWSAAEEAGQAGEQGFVHIACFLAWVIDRDLHAKRMLPPALVAASKAGTAPLPDYIDATDERLSDHVMNAEGRRFADHSYDAYTSAYEASFAGVADYAVPFDASTRRTTDSLLDHLYAAWVTAGRPAPVPEPEDTEPDAAMEARGNAFIAAIEDPIVLPWGATPEEIDEILKDVDQTKTFATVMLPPGQTLEDLRRRMEVPHDRPDLESRLPDSIGNLVLHTRSTAGMEPYDRPGLAEGLRRGGGDPASLVRVHGVNYEGRESGLDVTLWLESRIPPADLETLVLDAVKPTRSRAWRKVEMAGRPVWTVDITRPLTITYVVWATSDGVAQALSADQALLEAAVLALA